MTETRKCPRTECVNGYIEQYQHIENGVCFTCQGTGELTHEQYELFRNTGYSVELIQPKRAQCTTPQSKTFVLSRDQQFVEFMPNHCKVYTSENEMIIQYESVEQLRMIYQQLLNEGFINE